KSIACASALDRSGELLICSYDYTNDVPKPLRDIMGKVPGARKPEEQKQLDDYKKQGIREVARVGLSNSALYSVAFAPDGKSVAAAGSDGMIRLFNATNGALLKEFASVPLTKEKSAPRVLAVTARPAVNSGTGTNSSSGESLPDGAEVVSLEVQ